MNEHQISNLSLFKIFENKEGEALSPVASFMPYTFDTGCMLNTGHLTSQKYTKHWDGSSFAAQLPFERRLMYYSDAHVVVHSKKTLEFIY